MAAAELDGRPVVISGGDDGTVRVWDLATGTPAGGPFTGHTGEVTAVAAAELDGRPVVISGSGDGTVRVWDLATGAPLTGHTGEVTAVAAAELDGRPVVISGSGDGTVRVWDLATGTPLGGPFTGHAGRVRAVAAAELDGRPVVISGSDDGTVRVWDLARQRAMRHHLRRVQLRHAAPVLAAVLIQRRDRVKLITGCTDSVSQAWDLAAWRVLSRAIVPGQFGVAAIGALAPDHVLYANGSTLSLYEETSADAPILTIDLDSEIQALTTHGTSTAVAATRLGLVAFEVPALTSDSDAPANPIGRHRCCLHHAQQVI